MSDQKVYVLVEITTSAPDRLLPKVHTMVARAVHREARDLARYWPIDPKHKRRLDGLIAQNAELIYDPVIDDGHPPPGYVPKGTA